MSSEAFTGAVAGTKFVVAQTMGAVYGPVAKGITEIALGNPLMLSEIVTLGEKKENGTLDGGDYARGIKIVTDIAIGIALVSGAPISLPLMAVWGIVGAGLFIYNHRENIQSIVDKCNDIDAHGAAVTGDPFTGMPWPGNTDGAIDSGVSTNWRSALTPPRRDPLAIDLDGDGIETVGIPTNGNPILFDHDADGVKTGTGWLKSDDAWLVLDRNGNGTIDSGRELFGVDTVITVTELTTNADGSSRGKPSRVTRAAVSKRFEAWTRATGARGQPGTPMACSTHPTRSSPTCASGVT